MWQKEIEELENRKRIAYKMGGENNVNKHHEKGKMTVRERIAALADKKSFFERGILTGVARYDEEDKSKLLDVTPCPFIMGILKIEGQRVAVHGDDYTIKGASVGRLYKEKASYFAKMARSLKIPAIRLIEGAGGSIKEILEQGFTELPKGTQEGTQNQVEMMSEIPVVAASFGSAAGIAAKYLVQSHFSIMVKGSHVFVGGPPLLKWAVGQDYTKEELGGYKVHSYVSGVVDNVAEDEVDALNQIKTFLSYLPPNAWEMPKRSDQLDDPNRKEEELLTSIPKDMKKTYNIRKILRMVLDKDSIFEIGKFQGRSQITALARINGYPVGVLANDTMQMAGVFNYDVSEKFQRFIDMCDTFHIPIINFVDQPGFAIGKESELNGTIRKGVRASFSIVQSTIPISVIYLRKCFGVAGAAQTTGTNFSWQYAWPSAVWGNIPIEGGVYAAHKFEIESAKDPETYLKKLHSLYRAIQSPFRTAEKFGIEDIIDPRETRPLLCEWIEMAYAVERTNIGPKYRGMRI